MIDSGRSLLSIWERGRPNGLSQRKLAKYLGLPFNSMHGKIYREQKRLSEESVPYNVHTKSAPRVTLRAAVYDIETMDFKAGGICDHMICGCILPLDSDEIITSSLLWGDQRDDRRLLNEFVGLLSEFDILIGHNITAFDGGWLRSRLAYHGMPYPEKRWLHYDTYQAARRMAIKANRKSLAFLCDFFRVPFVKTAVLPVAWSMIDSPNQDEFRKALQDITYHCEEDVKSNRNLFDVLWPLDRSMQNLPVVKK